MKKWLAFLLAVIMLTSVACSAGGKEWETDYKRGLEFMQAGEYEDAIEAFTAAIDKKPKESKLYVHRGTAYMYETRRIYERRQNNPADNSEDEKMKKYLKMAAEDLKKAETCGYKEKKELKKKEQELEEIKIEVGYSVDAKTLTARIDYAIYIAALQEMACTDVKWELLDGDTDGTKEIYISACANDTGRASMLFGDADIPYSSSIVATGAAGNTNYVVTDKYESYVILDGYYSVGNTEETYSVWNGDEWEVISEAPENVTQAEYTSEDLKTTRLEGNVDDVAKMLQTEIEKDKNYLETVKADFDGDGTEEVVFLIKNAADKWFENLAVMNSFGNEYYLGYKDQKATAVVVSGKDTEVCVRMCRLAGYTQGKAEVKDDTLELDGVVYAYSADGEAFIAETIKDSAFGEESVMETTLDGRFIEVTVPDDWKGDYVYSLKENGAAPDSIYMMFYEKTEYESSGNGHLFTICMVEASKDTHSEADRREIGVLDVNGTSYNLYVTYPTDVQVMQGGPVERYQEMSEDVEEIIGAIREKPDVRLSYYDI